MRAQFIYEKFTSDTDPISDMGIGNPFLHIKYLDIIKIKRVKELNNKNIYKFINSFFKFHIPSALGASYNLELTAVVYGIRRYKNKLNLKLIFVNSIGTAKYIKDRIINKNRTARSYTTVEGTHTYEEWSKYFKIVKE